jgi:glycosyltransferase involved in cell wall biosynthesis
MALLRILIVHNRYNYLGGEDTVVATEVAVLRAFGHEVHEYRDSNEGFASLGLLQAGSELFWSRRTTRALRVLIRNFQPDIVHCHNIFYRVSPSVYWVCRELGVPVVQTLHNFRLGCANARLSRNRVPCELCLTSALRALHGVRYRCFQNSLLKTVALSTTTAIHLRLGTFSNGVEVFICGCNFALQRHILSGLPKEKLIVKPNCVYPDPGFGTGQGSFCLFVGRLEVDKGVSVLLEAAAELKIPIWVVGEGPLESEVRLAAARLDNLCYLGPLPRPEVLDLMKSAKLLLFPSLAYENFPMTIVEAFSVGLPVVASRQGAAREIVEDAITGAHFQPSSAPDLARVTRTLWNDHATLQRMRDAARAKYQTAYSGEATYGKLCSIYERAISQRRMGCLKLHSAT